MNLNYKVIFVSLYLACFASALANKPNILFITVDDMSFDSVGVYGSLVEDSTPNIDRLAGEGIQFDYGYVQMAMCNPSRHVMLSGNHSHQTMTRGFTNIERVGPTLPDLLKEHGYFTAVINKGVDHYPWDYRRNETETGFGRNVPRQREILFEILREAEEQPWFIMLNFNDPHRPFYHSEAEAKHGVSKVETSLSSRVYSAEEIVTPGFLPDLPGIRMEIAEYYSSVRRADDGVGMALDFLEESGLTENTVVVFMSDHGMSIPFAKLNCYQASLRVPLLVRYPGHIKSGQRDRKHMVSAIDLAPTLLDLLDIPIPSHMVGRSFSPLLSGEGQMDRNYVIGYYYRNLNQINMFPEFAVHMRDWVYIYNPWVDGVKQVHNSDYTLSPSILAMWASDAPSVISRSDFHKYRTIEELYNLRKDPHSYLNLATDPEYEATVKEMRQILVDWMEDTDHPAARLMKDPYNQELTSQYMNWERENAKKQLQEKQDKLGDRAFH